MTRVITALFLLAATGPVFAAESTEKAVAAPPAVAPAPAAPKPDPEVMRQWKSIQAQEQWVNRLKKQLENENKQLSSQRAALAQNFKLDPKKLEAGAYVYDEKSGAFVEKK